MLVQQIAKHPGARWAFFGWSAFLAENVVLSHNREYVISEIGNDKYHYLYNTLSTAACASIAYGLFRFRSPGVASRLWNTNRARVQVGAFALQGLGLVGFSQAAPRLQIPWAYNDEFSSDVPTNATRKTSVASSAATASSSTTKFHARCPFDFQEDKGNGLKQITRHPMLWSLGLFGIGSALVNPFPTQVVAFSMPIIFAWVGGAHKDYRYRRNWGGYLSPDVDAKTSNVPFLAILQGRNTFPELKWINAGLAVTVAIALATRRVRMPPL